MILSPADLSSVFKSLSRWETGEYVFEALVIIACVGELVADLAVCLSESRKKHLERISTMLLVAALSAELICLIKTNQLSGTIIDNLELQLADRHISLDQRTKMLEELGSASGRVAVTYLASSGSDSQEYALEVADVFRAAGWTVIPFPWLVSYDTPVHGFVIQVRNKESAKQEALEKAASAALRILDDRVSVTHGGQDPNSELKLDVEVLVGNK